MSNAAKYESYVSAIIAGTATSSQITAEPCNQLSTTEKQSLHNLLAATMAEDSRPSRLLQESSGEIEGGQMQPPAFFYGEMHIVDTDNSHEIGEQGTTQYITEAGSPLFAEGEATYIWPVIPNRHYGSRTIDVPAGVKVRYRFVFI